MENKNVLWEKHRMYLPDMRNKAVSRCGQCKFFVRIKGLRETRTGCVVNIKAYNRLQKRVPEIVPIMDIIKMVGLEKLELCLKNGNPQAQSCGKFKLRLKD